MIIFSYSCKYSKIIIIFFLFIIFLNNKNRIVKALTFKNKIIEENFFIIDSNNLEKVSSHLYGYYISKYGIITDNYMKEHNYNEQPEPQGSYILIRKYENNLIIRQDFDSSYGIYIYEDKKLNFFAISNSFLLLEEYLIGKINLTLNKDYADTLIISTYCAPSIQETLVNEINKLPSNVFLTIDIKLKSYKKNYIDYKENTIPLDSLKGLKIIDNWVDKWSYIFRSLIRKTHQVSCDLSGGFDTRTVLSILLNSGIKLEEILIKSSTNKVHGLDIDFKIAKNISLKYGFQLNSLELDSEGTQWSKNDSLFSSLFVKLGFHKQFYFIKKFFKSPRFSITGSGGETIRGYPGYDSDEYIKLKSNGGNKIKGYSEMLFNSSMRVFLRSLKFLKQTKIYNNNFRLCSDLVSKGCLSNHFGKGSVVNFMGNVYTLDPLLDPEIRQIKYDINGRNSHEIIAYIYVRFAKDLVDFPFQGNRTLNDSNIEKAYKLNKKMPKYVKKSDYNKNFYIDINRKSPVSHSRKNENVQDYLWKLFKSDNFINNIKKIYNIEIYNWAIEYSKKSNYFPSSHLFGLLAIEKIIKDLTLNKNLLTNYKNNN